MPIGILAKVVFGVVATGVLFLAGAVAVKKILNQDPSKDKPSAVRNEAQKKYAEDLSGKTKKDIGTKDFIKYENRDFGVRISYPKTWRLKEQFYRSGSELDVSFDPPGYEVSLLLQVERRSKAIPLDQFIDRFLLTYKEPIERIVLESKPDILSSIPGHKVIAIRKTKSGSMGKMMENLAVKNNMTYRIFYNETGESLNSPETYNKFLPIIEKMTDSFEIL